MTSGIIATLIGIITMLAGGIAWLLRKSGQRDEQWKRAVDDMEAREKGEAAAHDERKKGGTDEEIRDRIDKRTEGWK